jgi:hypothetical protein
MQKSNFPLINSLKTFLTYVFFSSIVFFFPFTVSHRKTLFHILLNLLRYFKVNSAVSATLMSQKNLNVTASKKVLPVQ